MFSNNVNSRPFNYLFIHLTSLPQIILGKQSNLENINAIAKNIFSQAKNFPRQHPKIFFSAVGGIFLLGGAYALHSLRKPRLPFFSIEKIVQTTHAYITANKDREAKIYINNFVKAYLRSNVITAQLGQESSDNLCKHLSARILAVFDIDGALENSQIIMVDNILSKFSSFISQIKNKVEKDVNQGKLNYFEIAEDDTLVEMLALGKETHNKGKIPFKLIFRSGKEIIYKPRSMLPELLLCDEDEGLLRTFGFGTYKVLNCEDEESGSDRFYGYCEVLKNIQDNNTVSSNEELRDYFKKLCVLEKIAQSLGLSDLHYQNILIANQSPYLIDAEVFLIPNFDQVGSGIFKSGDGAAYVFDCSRGTDPSLMGLNRLWFADGYLQKISGNENAAQLSYGITEEQLNLAGIQVENLLENIDMSQESNQEYETRIQEIYEILKQTRGRIVLLNTSSLNGVIVRIDPAQEETLQPLVNAIREEVEKLQLTFHEENLNLIKDQICVDIFNRDVPVFYYHDSANHLYYDNVLIGS
ncbi:hypothetical protein PHSC3_001981 [Chlamydiales bacterium STE3]|nr:hypothetical protein PHSC3_001981 [Chlamydiales bacterium STE3]